MNLNFKCPNCGANDAYYRYAVSTLLGFTPIVKDGAFIMNDPNITTTKYTCCKCGHDFSVREQYGKILDISDDTLIKERARKTQENLGWISCTAACGNSNDSHNYTTVLRMR